MSAFCALSYARYPRRILRTVRNVFAERSETVMEQRLVEYKRRWAGSEVSDRSRRGPAHALTRQLSP
jgi:hypothetical protein